jgi:hypothetical protein
VQPEGPAFCTHFIAHALERVIVRCIFNTAQEP